MESLNRDAPMVQRASLGALWEGQEVEASFAPKKKLIFFNLFFVGRFLLLLSPSLVSLVW
jgi:hypothetical protein